MFNQTGRWNTHRRTLALLLAACISQATMGAEPAPRGQHQTGCAAYDPDIATDLQRLADAGPVVEAAATRTAPGTVLETGRTYRVALKGQAGVELAVAPRRHVLEEGAYAGMVTFKVPVDGTWRVSLSKETWVEVVGPDGEAVESSRFQGREGCPAMRKFVEFPLQAGAVYALQLSGGTDPEMNVLVTGPVAAQP